MSGKGSVSGAAFCAVTVSYGTIRRDVALPTAVPTGDLTPGLVRLLEPDAPTTAAHRWTIVPLGRAPLSPGESLGSAGVLDGEVLLLLAQEQQGAGAVAPVTGSLRDQVEEIVTGRGGTWTARTSAQFAAWLVTAAGAVLLVPATVGDRGPSIGVVTTVAATLALVAAVTARRSLPAAAGALAVGCGWAALAGWTWLTGSTVGGAVSSSATTTPAGLMAGVALAAGCASLLAGAVAAVLPLALVHASVGATMAVSASTLLVVTSAGAPPVAVTGGMALVAVLSIGAAPRLALAVGGLSAAGTSSGVVPVIGRIDRANRVLTGIIVGLSAAAVLGALPAALSTDGWQQLFAGGIGLGLLLRSRAFSQIPHVLGPRLAGIAVLSVLCCGIWRLAASPLAALILGAVTVGGIFAVAVCLAPDLTPVARARMGKFFDVTEMVVVVASVVLAAGAFGLFAWVGIVVGN